MTQQFTVHDREREFSFEGELIGHASSAASGKKNWIELSIYRTTSNRYIVAGVGKTSVPGQQDRPWAHVCETAAGVVEACYLVDEKEIRYLTLVNRRALTAAALEDEDIMRAFTHEVVT